ncbi:MAG: phosphate acyltransferase PlsX [Oscillospiraceae bacterium]|jgi:glycerol-3-phosphate acyltransferase PlsX|nr:phosphate acyltransferase PlsX [Oscillospiraceae bacterium]
MAKDKTHTIVIDAMGGDYAPEIPVRAALAALKEWSDIAITLVGRADKLNPLLSPNPRITVVNASDVITNDESPVMALRRKPDASLSVALKLLREGQADALVSAGSTGAVMAGAMFKVERIEGVARPALAVLIPTLGTPCLLLDAGANADITPDILQSFAVMGDVYAKNVMGIKEPRVALVNIGEEAEKGSNLTKEAHKLLAAVGQPFRFVGNVEGRGIPLGECDVAVCDGFTGNVFLKTMEGVSKAIFTKLKTGLSSSFKGKLGGLLAQDTFRGLKKELSPDEVGGALMLGVNRVVVKAHGNSNERAYLNAIKQAYNMEKAQVVGKITDAMPKAQTL